MEYWAIKSTIINSVPFGNSFADLAEQELFTQDVKKDTIPNPSAPAAPAPYPKINLKDIARYVSLYRSVAKKLFGEALDSAKKEFVAQQSKKSDIPIPIKDELKSESKPSSSSLEGFYSSQEQKKRDDIPMNPNNAVYTPSDESWANRAYKEAESYLRSKIPEFKNYAPPAMFNYPFYINDPNKTVEETNEGLYCYKIYLFSEASALVIEVKVDFRKRKPFGSFIVSSGESSQVIYHLKEGIENTCERSRT